MCVTPDTLVQLSDGGITEARNIHNPLGIAGIDFNNLKLSEGTCNGVYKSNRNRIIEINNSLRISPEHTVFRVNGLDVVETEAKYLKKGDYLIVPKQIGFEGEDVELSRVEPERVFVISKEGSKIIKKEVRKRRISLKKKSVELFGVTPRHLRRILNQSYPTREVVIKKITKSLGVSLSKCVKEVETNKHKKIKIPKKLSPSVAQLLGYFLGDGSLYENSIRWRDYRHEVLENYNRILFQVFGLKGRISKVKNKNCYQLEISNKYIAELFRYLADDYFVLSKSKKDCIKGFLRGIFDAECSIEGSKLYLRNTDRKLLEFIKLLLLRFGIHSKIHKQEKAFSLSIIRDSDRFFDMIGLTALDKVSKFNRPNSKREIIPIDRKLLNQIFKKYKIKKRTDLKYITREYLGKLCTTNPELRKIFARLLDSDLSFEKITSIRILNNREELIDISVPGTENFIANGYLVHNSTYRLYLRRGKEGTRISRLVDSPGLPEGEAVFKITEAGITDP
ncbi:MAG: LAGLIDADG family homing endonuclease [Candidatus Aenigmarchaeota archaeon]|nr:LAGLIDADG family homing endonuclease [Candidatus Aenigmarchaeota archaeon]